jgi:hypothetical protein
MKMMVNSAKAVLNLKNFRAIFPRISACSIGIKKMKPQVD